MSEDAALQRREVYYSGVVQGVGFRYTVRHIAARLPVTGYVQNLPDGRVKLVAEGHPTDLERLLHAISREMGPYIDRVDQQIGPAKGEFRSFEIRF